MDVVYDGVVIPRVAEVAKDYAVRIQDLANAPAFHVTIVMDTM
jgi:hypothetical protein